MTADQKPPFSTDDFLLPHWSLPKTTDNETLIGNARPGSWDNPEPKGTYDLVVLGGGPAGLTAALFAIDHGKRVALTEEALLGGECFNIGCIPSKSIIRTALLYSDMQNAGRFGARAPKDPEVDFPQIMARMQRIRAQLSEEVSAELLRRKGIDVYFGRANFAGRREVSIAGRTLRFKKSIVATGSRPLIPAIPGLTDVDFLTNETVFNLEALPESLLVIGGGSIGCELAQAFCRLGSRVTIVQTEPMFLDNIERDGAQILADALSDDGVSIHLNSWVAAIRKDGAKKTIDIVRAGNKTTITVTDILVGVGQKPNTTNLGLELADVKTNKDGAIEVDNCFRTSNRRVFAVGTICNALDVNRVPVAAARMAARNALLGARRRADPVKIPWCIYTDPEVAHIGLQVREARTMKIPVKTFTVLMHQVDRAVADSEDRGFVKVHVEEGTDKILGATIVSRHASDIMNGISLAMELGIGLKTFAKINYPYPTQGDAVRKAAVACAKTLGRPSFVHALLNLKSMMGWPAIVKNARRSRGRGA